MELKQPTIINFNKINYLASAKDVKNKIDLIVSYLKKGRVIVYPADTVYGLGCLATNIKAINKINKIKQRRKKKPFLILVSSYSMLKKYCYVSRLQEKYLRHIWSQTRPTSVILKNRGILPKELTVGDETIGVRLLRSIALPKYNFLITIISRVGIPIVSTSLNISESKNITNVSNIFKYFKNYKPDLVINIGSIKSKQPSKLIDIREIKPDYSGIKILRS